MKVKKNFRGGRSKKKLLANFHTLQLYNKTGVVKPTCVSEVSEFVNIFGEFTIFCSKNDLKAKNFVKDNKKDFSNSRITTMDRKIYQCLAKDRRYSSKIVIK